MSPSLRLAKPRCKPRPNPTASHTKGGHLSPLPNLRETPCNLQLSPNTTSIQATGTTSPAVAEECSSRSASQPVGHTLITIRCTMDNRLFLVVAAFASEPNTNRPLMSCQQPVEGPIPRPQEIARKRPQLIPCSGRQCKVKIHRVCSSTPISATDYVLMKKQNEVFDYFCPKCSSHPSTSGSTTTRQVVAVENLAIPVTRKRGRQPKTREVVAVENSDVPVEVRKRGRPRKRPALPPSPTTTRHVNAPKRLCLRPVLSSSGVGLVGQDYLPEVWKRAREAYGEGIYKWM
ncbi:hypothetical protein DAPPUDRAFT_256499 [Daphnia pulex]|uniref:Uncharacterized protein n=1 Tax=Daphnia pulex TaxID=6669 RepID=E9HBH9_DAPPU|nr:hypothetical protein DAPPUDRAFT_256499 [Daphnia pulex]|eukprot:EFX70914.1 hypothetical protein DAPPUDRAFT_256499 [Daphnia pulex]